MHNLLVSRIEAAKLDQEFYFMLCSKCEERFPIPIELLKTIKGFPEYLWRMQSLMIPVHAFKVLCAIR